ncbi:MAG: efflux RND transporter periplasmic adaptor subunit [Candidatus Limnocylindrales bacterium]
MTTDPAPRRSRMPFGVAFVVIVGIVVAVAVANGAFRGSGPAATEAPSVPGVIPADGNVVAEGRAMPVRSIELEVGAPGTVATVDVAEGDAVTSGQALLALDTTTADADVAAATASVDAATARVAQAQASLAQAKASATGARAGVDVASAARRVAIAARDAVPSDASSAVKRQADAQVDEASASLEQAKAQRAVADAVVRGAEAGVTAAQADEARAKATADRAAQEREQLVVRTPFAGTVVSVGPVVGDRVQPGVVLVRVADLSAWRFETSDLSETSIARVQDGAAATITVDGLPGVEIPGTVASVGVYGASIQGDITFRVVVTPTGAVPAGLRWNMTVTIEITGPTGG